MVLLIIYIFNQQFQINKISVFDQKKKISVIDH